MYESDSDSDNGNADATAGQDFEIEARIRYPLELECKVKTTRVDTLLDQSSTSSLISAELLQSIEAANPGINIVKLPQKGAIFRPFAKGLRTPRSNLKALIPFTVLQAGEGVVMPVKVHVMKDLYHDVLFGRKSFEDHEAYAIQKENQLVCRRGPLSQQIINLKSKPKLGTVSVITYTPEEDFRTLIQNVVDKTVLLEDVECSLLKVLLEVGAIFDPKRLGKCNAYQHQFNISAIQPFTSKAYPIPHKFRSEWLKTVNRWEELRIVVDSDSTYLSPILMVPKRDGSMRPCIDFQDLNKSLSSRGEVVPLIPQIKTFFSKATVFSTLDFNEGF